MAVEGTAPVFFLRPCRRRVSDIPRSPATLAAFGRWDFSHACGVVEMTRGGVHRRGALDMWYTIHLPASRDTAPAPSLSLAGTLGRTFYRWGVGAPWVERYSAGAV